MNSEVPPLNNSQGKYPLEIFSKCRSYNHDLPSSFNCYKFMNDDYWKKKHISCLNSAEIRACLNSHINKRNITSEDESLYEKIQALLNKLSATNFNEIGNEIKDLPYVKKKHIFKLCESIIIKSVNENSFCVTYAKLSHTLFPYYIAEQIQLNGETKTEKIYFRSALFTICQDMFEELTNTRVAEKTFDYNRSTDYAKLKLCGLMKFLAELYNCDVLNDKIIYQCFATLYKLILKGDDYYDAISIFVQTFCKKLKIANINVYKKIYQEIKNLLEADNSKKVIYEGQTFDFKFPKLMNKFKILETIEFFNSLEKPKN
ncbi:eukaryotic translation initiation factor 4G [Catovirus CTV1]|uniref:Eukaryotic translation initiation factor 4G n=1 Tax=Catovirus CTV1 TaxID=1977631 RepID=A0A1V0SC38_9VIRU|nr:eukaryotic translation initiation factor 4G [Catovirus CTV1]